jgi:hypothetical protein
MKMLVNSPSEVMEAIASGQVDEIGLVFLPPSNEVEVMRLEGPNESKMGIYAKAVPRLMNSLTNENALINKENEQSLLRLILNAERHSDWAIRKRLLLASHPKETSLGFEFRACLLVVQKQPKAGFAFEHLAWVINESLKAAETKLGKDAIIQCSLNACEKSIVNYRRLYFGWSLRHSICQRMDQDWVEKERLW